jgi:hypothetical protein
VGHGRRRFLEVGKREEAKKKPPGGAGGFIGFGSLLQVCERAPDSSRRRQEKPKK